MGFFKDVDIEKAEAEIQGWAERHPEASEELAIIWRGNLMTAGHKTQGRKILHLEKKEEE